MDTTLAGGVERRVLRLIRQHHLIPPGSTVLLAVSGGADSLALVQILARLQDRVSATLHVAYVDHGLRAVAALEAERAFVAEIAASLGIEFHGVRVATDTVKRSPEDAARTGRYHALARLAGALGAERVATGHTRSDQAETVLLRLLRGAGIAGLAAMVPDAPWPVPDVVSPRLLRPLLGLSRAETASYCAAAGLTPCDDETNADRRFLRNRVRLDVLPLLRAMNPRVEVALADLAEESHLVMSAFDALLERAAVQRGNGPDGVLCLDTAALQSLAPAARRAALRAALRAVMPPSAGPARAHILALEALALRDGDAQVSLPGRLLARRVRSMIRLGAAERDAHPAGEPDRPVPFAGEFHWSGFRISVTRAPFPAGAQNGDRWAVALDPALAAELTVGSRRRGERMELVGMSGHKRLQDLMVDAKVPRAERERLPVFRTARGVAWVAGLRVAHWARPAGAGALHIQVHPPERDPPSAHGSEFL